jgi:hypothetical protein
MLPGKRVFWAEALLTPKQQTPPTAKDRILVFLDMILSYVFTPPGYVQSGRQQARQFAAKINPEPRETILISGCARN